MSIIHSKAQPQKVWQFWQKAQPWNHWGDDSTSMQTKSKGHVVSKKGKAVPYKILEVKEGSSFTVCWKALFLRLIFTYRVEPAEVGSKITYLVNIKGIFSWPIRWILRRKIQRSLDEGLKSFADQV